MENSEKKLLGLINEINLIYLAAQDKQTLQTKLKNYNNSLTLLANAKQLIDSLQNEITQMDSSGVDKTKMNSVNHLIDIMDNMSTKFSEVVNVVQDLKKIKNGLPITSNVHDNMEKEVVIYEEQDIDDARSS